MEDSPELQRRTNSAYPSLVDGVEHETQTRFHVDAVCADGSTIGVASVFPHAFTDSIEDVEQLVRETFAKDFPEAIEVRQIVPVGGYFLDTVVDSMLNEMIDDFDNREVA